MYGCATAYMENKTQKEATCVPQGCGGRGELPQRARLQNGGFKRVEHTGPRCSSSGWWPSIQHLKNTTRKKQGHLVPRWRGSSQRINCWLVTGHRLHPPARQLDVLLTLPPPRPPWPHFPRHCVMVLPALALTVGIRHKLCAPESSNTNIIPRDAGLT